MRFADRLKETPSDYSKRPSLDGVTSWFCKMRFYRNAVYYICYFLLLPELDWRDLLLCCSHSLLLREWDSSRSPAAAAMMTSCRARFYLFTLRAGVEIPVQVICWFARFYTNLFSLVKLHLTFLTFCSSADFYCSILVWINLAFSLMNFRIFSRLHCMFSCLICGKSCEVWPFLTKWMTCSAEL